MNDVDALVRLRPDAALPTPAELAEARRRLLAAIGAEQREACEPTLLAAMPPSAGLRARSSRLATVGVAAAVAAGVVAYLGVPRSESRARGDVPVAQLTATRFLARAARAVIATAPSPPQPGQFVYSETKSPSGSITRSWLSADGTRPGLTETISPSGASPASGSSTNLQAACSVAQAGATACFPSAGYLPDLPTDPSAVLAYLNAVGLIDTAGGAPKGAAPGWENNVIGKAVSYLMSSTYLLPRQEAALYRLMAETPGFAIVPSMADAVGRNGVGIEWSFDGTAALIFDPSTYALLGTRTWPPGEAPGTSASYDGDALVQSAVVDRPGQLPGTGQ